MSEDRFAGAVWRKSTHSGDGGCVEVAYAGGMIGVRDTKANGTGPALAFTEQEWVAFLAGARDGEFEIDTLSR
jgi:hypothetical protein